MKKIQIIETPDYTLAVSDEEIKKENCYLYNKLRKDIKKCLSIERNRLVYSEEDVVIIAYQSKNNAPELDLPLLPEIVVEDDVEKLAKQAYKKHNVKDDTFSLDEQIQRSGGFLVGYKEGYKAATKVYSEEDLRKAFNAGDNYRYYQNNGSRNIPSDVLDEDEYIQSLKQPKTLLTSCEKALEERDKQIKKMYSEEDMIEFAEFIMLYPNKNKNYLGQILHAKSKYDGAERTIDLLKEWSFIRNN
jgi:hypothetical protein